ncbi:MAG: hypothetical protein RL375_2202, partial [Pseudomonadota bacterium]
TVYRMGLGHRYGRRMQTISGIHYNWSLPGLTSADYFSLIRNFRRHGFLLLFLFGASPALCQTFVAGRDHPLDRLGEHTLYLPHATSLRMGKLGYQSDAQSTLAVSYNSLDSYAASLHDAMTRPYPAYEALGLRGPGGDYHQLATSLLQLENEFYGTIRPKRVIHQGERPLHALRERGVEYVEVRCMDLDPFLSLGIDAPTMRFIDVFLLYCLLADSPADTPAEIAELAHNQDRVAMRGREPGLRLERGGREVTLVEWADEILAACAPLAAAVDKAQGGTAYVEALRIATERLAAPASLPSARVIDDIVGQFDCSYTRFVRDRAAHTRDELLALPYPPELHARMVDLVQTSIAQQAQIEAGDTMPFEIYRQEYLSTRRLGV